MTDMTREEVLRNAKMADLLQRPVSDEALAAVLHIRDLTIAYEAKEHPRERKRTSQALVNFDATIGALLADLVSASANESSEGYCYRGSDRANFKDTLAESRPYETLKTLWKGMDLMEVVDGFRGTDDWEGESFHPDSGASNWVTRLRAAGALLDILKGFGISVETISQHFKRDHSKTKPVILRAAKKGRAQRGATMEYEANARTKKMNAELTEINEFLSDFTYSFGPQPNLKRIFNNGDQPGFDWDEGGRFYVLGDGNYIGLSSEERKFIKIDNEPVNDVDISACALTLMHGILGYPFDPSKDAYAVEGIPRKTVKKIVNTIIGRGEIPTKAPRDFFSDLSVIGKPNFAKLRDRVLEQVPVLQEVGRKDVSSTCLQFIDSEIIKNTILTLIRNFETPALPVHDCLIVQSKNIELAADMLTHSFYREVGVKPRLSIS